MHGEASADSLAIVPGDELGVALLVYCEYKFIIAVYKLKCVE